FFGAAEKTSEQYLQYIRMKWNAKENCAFQVVTISPNQVKNLAGI
ncbi:unnamed protein product, partial [Allacma fusca]